MKGNDVVPPDGVDLPELPVGWRWVYLRELLTRIASGKNFKCEERPPTHSEHGIVKISAITWGIYDENESKTITDNERVNLAHIIRTGDFLFSRANTIELVGACLIVHETHRSLLLSDKILRFEFAGDFKNWINWMLKSRLGRTQIEALSTGNQESMRNIGQKQIGHICVPVPPANEQRRIVDKIEELFSKLDKGVEALTAARQQLKAYRESVLKYAFDGTLSAKWRKGKKPNAADIGGDGEISPDELTGFPELPRGWTYVRLGYFLERVDAGKSFRCEERMPGDQEIGVAKVSAVTWGEYNEDESKTCTDPKKVNPRYFIKEGDFLFSRANTIELVGACVVAKKVSRMVMLSDKTLRLVFRDLPAHYFLYYLRSHLGRREIMRRSTGNQESMRNIGQDRLKSIVIPMCSSEEANYIQARIQDIFSSIDYVEASLETEREKSTALRQSILREAFSGRLVKQDAKDEPATALLERIRSERAGEMTKKERGTKNGRRKAA